MKIYVGEVVKKAVNSPEQPISKTHIARQIGLSRTQFYNILNEIEMDPVYVLQIGRAIGKDFRGDITGLKDYPEEEFISENDKPLQGLSYDQIKNELIELQRKYIHALEDIRQLQKEIREIEKKK